MVVWCFPSVYLGFMQLVRNGTALQADLTCLPNPTISHARLVGQCRSASATYSMRLCLSDLTAIALRAPKRICNLYEDCGNALSIVLIFPLAFGHPLSVCADYVLHLHLSRL